MGKNVLFVVTGGIAAYKAVEAMRELQKKDCDVRVVMTDDAERFVGRVTFEALSGHEVGRGFYDFAESPIPHIYLAEWADVVLVCPATANTIAKMVAGIADNLASATLLAAACPVVVAPAMNVNMWNNPATRANVSMLIDRGILVVNPASGHLACGSEGEGKLAPVSDIAAATLAALAENDLAGLRVVVTAGPTHEAIDPVRYIANGSSGKTGYAVAAAAAARGAHVTLVSGPTALKCPYGVCRVDVTSAAEMLDATVHAADGADIAILSAAVADYTPSNPADHKLKKANEPLSSVELVETGDILKTLCSNKGKTYVVGFAAETDKLEYNAERKLYSKGADLIVANDVSRSDSAFGSNTRRVTFVSKDGFESEPTLPLEELANLILDKILDRMGR